MHYFSRTPEEAKQKTIENLTKSIWKKIGQAPHNVKHIEDKILCCQDLLFSHKIDQSSPVYTSIVQDIKEWNMDAMHHHFENNLNLVRSVHDWKTKWFFLPINNNFIRFLTVNQETKLNNMLDLQQEIFIDLLSQSSSVRFCSNLTRFYNKN